MAVYSLPDQFKNAVPQWTGESYESHVAKEAAFLAELVAYVKARNPSDPLVGKIMFWPVADGQAQYLVAATKPVQLLHLPLGDAWQYPLAHRATKKDIADQVRSTQAMRRFLGTL